MIVLDTNVVSELIKPSPDPSVIAWVDKRDVTGLVITSISAAELRSGVALLPEGRRMRNVAENVEGLLQDTFAGYTLAFDSESSIPYAQIVASRRGSGRPINVLDAQIAAVCIQHDAALATRNVRDFTGTDVHTLNPWGTG